MPSKIQFATIGIDHPHANHQNAQLLASKEFELIKFFGTDSTKIEEFRAEFPQAELAGSMHEILEDPSIQLINCAAIPNERSAVAIAAMEHGKDVLVDKLGVTTMDQLDQVRRTQAKTGHHYYVWYGERLDEPATAKAAELAAAGRIGKVIQTIGIGPHRHGLHPRPDWFYSREKTGGILVDILSHQMDQFLHFTGSTEAEVVASQVGNFRNPQHPELEDFGDVMLRGNGGTGYARVDWLTPDGLDTWGDGRLVILGTDGYIEVRKFIDIAGRPGGSHLFIVDQKTTEYVDISGYTSPFAGNLAHDVRERTNTALGQEHCFLASKLQLIAEEQATRLGNLAG